MSLIPVNPSLKSQAFPNLTGGLSYTPAKDNECPVFENVDVGRDGWLVTRTGTAMVNDLGTLGSAQVTGIANLGINDGRLYIVVAKQGTNFFYHIPSVNWHPGLYANWASFTVPYDGGTDRVNFTSAFISGTPAEPPGGKGEHNPNPSPSPTITGLWSLSNGDSTRSSQAASDPINGVSTVPRGVQLDGTFASDVDNLTGGTILAPGIALASDRWIMRWD